MQSASHHASRYFANLRHAIMFQPVWVPVYLQILHLVAACSPRPPAQCRRGVGAGHRCGFRNLSLSSAVRFPDSSVIRLVPLQLLAAPLPPRFTSGIRPRGHSRGALTAPITATSYPVLRHPPCLIWETKKKNKNTKSYWTIFNYL